MEIFTVVLLVAVIPVIVIGLIGLLSSGIMSNEEKLQHDIDELFELKERNILSETEYNEIKQKLISKYKKEKYQAKRWRARE